MIHDAYTTPEGFALHRPLLLPDARTFADVLQYVAEWDHPTMAHRSGTLPANHARPEPRYIGADGAIDRPHFTPKGELCTGHTRGSNEIGPFCTVELGQLGGNPARRSIAVRATDAVMAAVAPRIVTPDDHLSFQVIGHASTGRALVVLQHGYIIGSHYLAYIDPATIPAYPFAARDAAVSGLCDRIRAATAWVPWKRELPNGAADYGYDGWYPGADKSGHLTRRGSLPRTRPVVVAHVNAVGTIDFYPEGLAHLQALETATLEATV